MCGICGFVSKESVGETELCRMRDTLAHRGPDDAGQKMIKVKDYNVGLAHRRLSIIDLSPSGHQPMSSSSENEIIVFNGEIYNYLELRKELNMYPYQSRTDTEVLLAAYEKWGLKFVNRCNGMFAIALLDRDRGNLHLLRDRLGQKPLYYYYDGNKVVFASELKSVIEYPGLKCIINRAVLGRYLVKQCIASPDTIFENIYKVEPGEIVTIEIPDKEIIRLHKEKYWDINRVYKIKRNQFKGSYRDARQQLTDALKRAVDYRMLADVPIGILLSGGYDSSVIAALAQKSSREKIRTYSIGITDSSLDEARYAKRVANYLGTDHHELYISKDDMCAMIREIPQYYDEPFADSSQIATMLVSRLAKQEVTVVLTGDGGDELFAGYPIYEEAKTAQKADVIGKILYVLKDKKILGGGYAKLPFPVRMIAENRDKKGKTQFNYQTKIETAKRMFNDENGISANYDESEIPVHSWSIKRMLLDTQTYLPDDLFCKVDRASMMFSLEARSPFMDVNVVEFALSMPHHYKLKNKKGKRILKDIAWELMPKDLLNRPKSGFEVPIDEWLRNELREKLIRFSRRKYLKEQGIFNPIETEEVIDNYLNNEVNDKRGQKLNTVIWSFFIFQSWYENYREYISK